jgi:hypothetical protein
MKITKRQLKRIIREERARLNEGMKEREAELIDLIADKLISYDAIGTVGPRFQEEPDYNAAVEYLQTAVIPALKTLALDQEDAFEVEEVSYSAYDEPSRV